MKRADKIAKERYLQQLEIIKSGATVNIYETKEEQKARIERAKKDPRYFVEYYLPHYATSKSAAFQIQFAKHMLRNKAAKVLLRWGRGLAKSVWADLITPLWLWIQDDIHYMVLVGNNLDKAKILLSDIQAEFEANPRLIHDFGEQKMLGSWEDGHFKTKNGFIAKALGMGQSPRGLRDKAQRPDYISCDDLEDKELIKNPKRQDEIVQWIEQDLLPTMDGEYRRYVHPNNNFAPRTIQGRLEERHPNWKLTTVDAYDQVTYEPAWPEKYTADYYQSLEDEIGVLAARAEYNNNPHVEGKIFKDEQIQWDTMPRLNHFKKIVGHWDIAYAGTATSDYNAVRVWGLKDTDFWYIDSFVQQSKMKAAVEWMCDFQSMLPASVSVAWQYEAQFWNDEVKRTIEEVEKAKGQKLHLVKIDTPKVKKYDRIEKLQPYYQNARIFYNIKKKAHRYTIIGLDQLKSIEPGYRTHDDAPDADEQAIIKLEKFIKGDFKPRKGRFKKRKNRSLV